MADLTESKKTAILSRAERKEQIVPSLSPSAKETLIQQYHPDYKTEAYREIKFGPNHGEKTVHELADLLEARSSVTTKAFTDTPNRSVDILIIGGGGAGAAAALTAKAMGASVLLATKLRLGDANTVMAEGGMQVAISKEDTPIRHYIDTMRGGHMENDPILLKTLVEEGPAAAKWLIDMGVLFDREENGSLSIRGGGGSSKPRLLRCKDYTGLEMMRVLKDEVQNRKIDLLEFSPVVELLTDGTVCTGAILKDLDNGRLMTISAKTVILATGGIGRLHIQGFPTSNHYGATADALPIAYRAGAKLTLQDTFQYHPTGAVFPEPIAGMLVTEALRSVGAQLVNAKGDRFIYEMETRDAVAAAVIRECKEGRGVTTTAGRQGVWLDLPLVDVINGEGTLNKRFPNMVRQFGRYQIDITKEPVLIYPTLHYQNGGVEIDADCESTIKNLFVAGEASGGIHGRNRLMGNSLLDIIVFGRRAGFAAAKRAVAIPNQGLTLQHLTRFYEARELAGVTAESVSPILFPDYVNHGVSS
jgi:succinate dehydrogenase / fumarate reductase flavoprotein subunit/L-aspartate oxidase